MTTKAQNPEFKGLSKLGTKSIDMVALAAALLWVAAMLAFSWWTGGETMLVWLMRGMWGAIFVYAIVFLSLHAVVLKARSTSQNISSRVAKKEEIEEDALAELQAADSDQLARIISSNVTEQL